MILRSSRTLLSCSGRSCSFCSIAASAAPPTTSSTLHVLWAGTSTSASRCCSSDLPASFSTSSPCLFWPRLSVNLTRFVIQLGFLNSMIHPLELWELVAELIVDLPQPSVRQRPSLLQVPDAGFQLLDGQSQTFAQLVSGRRPLP